MKTRKSTKVHSHQRQPQERTEKETLLDEFTIHLNTAFAAPGGPARRELVNIVRRSNHNLGLAIADVLVSEKISMVLIQCMEDEDMEAAAAQIILGEKKKEASRKAMDGDLLQQWFDHVTTT